MAMGNHKAKPHTPRRAAVVLRCNSRVWAVKQTLQDGTQQWTLPGGKQTSQDASLHATGLRELWEHVGIWQEGWYRLSVKGPVVDALPVTTYYTCHLNQCVPKAVLGEHFQKRRQAEEMQIGEGEWVDITQRREGKLKWREEDAALLSRWRDEAQGRRQPWRQ